MRGSAEGPRVKIVRFWIAPFRTFIIVLYHRFVPWALEIYDDDEAKLLLHIYI